MKHKSLLFIALLTVSQLVVVQKLLANSIPSNLCKANGLPVVFHQLGSVGSPLIINAIAKISNESQLVYHFNPFYGIGGKVSLQTNKSFTTLLIWDNDFSEPIHHTVVTHNQNHIECHRF